MVPFFSFRRDSKKPTNPEQQIRQLESDIAAVDRIIAHCQSELQIYDPEQMEKSRTRAQEEDRSKNPLIILQHEANQKKMREDLLKLKASLAQEQKSIKHFISDAPTLEETRLLREIESKRMQLSLGPETNTSRIQQRRILAANISASTCKAGICVQALATITKAHGLDHDPLPPGDVNTLQALLRSATSKSSIVIFPADKYDATKEQDRERYSTSPFAQAAVDSFITYTLKYTPPTGTKVTLLKLQREAFTQHNIQERLLYPILEYAQVAKEQLIALRDELIAQKRDSSDASVRSSSGSESAHSNTDETDHNSPHL